MGWGLIKLGFFREKSENILIHKSFFISTFSLISNEKYRWANKCPATNIPDLHTNTDPKIQNRRSQFNFCGKLYENKLFYNLINAEMFLWKLEHYLPHFGVYDQLLTQMINDNFWHFIKEKRKPFFILFYFLR